MNIIYDCRQFPGEFHSYESSRFFIECLVRWMNENRSMDCFFLNNSGLDPDLNSIIPASKLILQYASGMGRKWPFEQDRDLCSILKETEARLLIGGPRTGRVRLQIPYGLWVPGLSLPDSGKLNRSPEKNWAGASVIFTDAPSHRKSILERFSFSGDKVVELSGAADPFYRVLSWAEKEKIKEMYTGGKEYFLSTQPILDPTDLVQILTSFSFFKKKQQSNMQLVFLDVEEKTLKNFAAKRETFRYRVDLQFFNSLSRSESAKLMSAAYAYLQPFCGGSTFSLLNALQARIPIIAGDQAAYRELAGEAACYVDPKNHQELASKMSLLYKDEQLRNQIIKEGEIRIGLFGWEKSIHQLGTGISRAMQAG